MSAIAQRLKSHSLQAVVPLMTFLARKGRNRELAFMLKRLISPMLRSQSGETSLLGLPKSGFNEDFITAFGRNEGYKLLGLDRRIVKAVFAAFLPEHVDDNNYLTGDHELEEAKPRLRTLWRDVLPDVLGPLDIRAAFTGNFSYAAEQELAGAFRELGRPFIALHKECLKTPGLEPFYVDVYQKYKNNFQGNKVLVYNEIEKRIQLNAGVVDESDIEVCGMPRMDRVHDARKKLSQKPELAPDKPLVLFFLFNTKAGLPILGRKLPSRFEELEGDLERLHVTELSRTCHHSVARLAEENPDIRVVIKTKGDRQSAITLEQHFGTKPNLPGNLEIMAGGDLMEVLDKATVVSGFSTTALFESLALDKDIVVPRFHEALNPELAPYVFDFGDAVSYADSEDDYVSLLKRAAKGNVGRAPTPELRPETIAMLDHWVGNSDGLAGQRVRNAVTPLIATEQE